MLHKSEKSFLGTILIVFAVMTACQAPATAPTPTPTAATAPTDVPVVSAPNVVRLTNGEFTPYLSENLPHYGVASRIVSEAFALKGYTVRYGFFPWARALKLAQDGDWDGSVIWHKTPEREPYFYFSDSVMDNQDVFFHLKTYTFDWKEFKDLAGIHIGATIDYNYGEAFMQAEKDKVINVERVASDEQNFKKLLAGRIDIFPLDLEVGLALLREKFTPEEVAQITYHPLAIQTSPYSLILSNKLERNKELMMQFNAGLKELKDSGQFEQIINEARQGK